MSGFHVTHVDMAPDFAGTLMGITNGISNFNGIIAPFVVTALTDPKSKITEWWAVFLIACAVYVITNLVYCWLGTSNLRSWARSNFKEVVNVYVCDNSYPKKDAFLLSDLKKDTYSNGASKQIKQELKTELLNTKN